MPKKQSSVELPLTHALAWIVASALVCSGGSYALITKYFRHRHAAPLDPGLAIRSVIQTGPQKEALKTECLAEWLGLSSDRWIGVDQLDLQRAQEQLLLSPLISRAEVQLIRPNILYIDYTVRQPIAWLEDYENVVVDKEGYLFPFHPFFPPKHLISIYLGLAPFGIASPDSTRPTAQWNQPLQGKHFLLALEIFQLVTGATFSDLLSVKKIDVSNAFADSYGTREIVVFTEDTLMDQIDGREVTLCAPRILRLSTKHYAQELGNYLQLRKQLLEEERKQISAEGARDLVRLNEKIIDFRIHKLAFIDQKS